MPSQTLVFFRALTMLAALVAFPLYALQGGQVPDEVWDLVGRVRERAAELVAATQPPATTAPPPLDVQLRHPGMTSQAPARATPAAAEYAPPAEVTPAAAYSPPAVVPASYAAVLPEPQMAEAPPASASEPFEAIQTRLKALGATSYALETWGTDGMLYRFQSDVAIHGDPNFHRHFEAIGDDPLAAMQDVLVQVESWRSESR